MKTVIDAVNEFKGEWRTGNKFVCHDTGKAHWFFTDNHRVRAFHGNYHLVCDTDQFNDLVSQMETNFGKCEESYRGYKVQFEYMTNKSDKELEVMDIEDKFEFCDNSGTHTITSNNILCCADTGRVVAVFYNEHDLREATGLVKKVSLTDGNCYQFDYHTGANTTLDQVTGMYDDNGDCMWIKGNNYSVDLCTNIQPLTVEVK